MSVVALIFLPLILLYQGWTYHVFRAPARRRRARGGGAHRSRRRPGAADDACARSTRASLRRARPVRRLLARRRRARARRRRCCRSSQADAARADRRPRVPRRGARRRRAGARSCSSRRSPARGAARLGFRGRRAPRGGERALGASAELVERRLRDQPAALDGAEAAELAAAAVQGVDGLEAYFGRYLPQLVLAVPRAARVLAWVAAIDPTSALADARSRCRSCRCSCGWSAATRRSGRGERWHALRLLSTHFLDVVRGLPTLRAFNRGRAAGGDHRRRRRALPARDDGHAAGRASSPARCSSWPPRSAWRWSRSRSACGSSTAASACRPG